MQIMRMKRVCKDFKIKYLGEYHDLHVQSDIMMYLTTLEICVLKYSNLILQNLFHLLD